MCFIYSAKEKINHPDREISTNLAVREMKTDCCEENKIQEDPLLTTSISPIPHCNYSPRKGDSILANFCTFQEKESFLNIDDENSDLAFEKGIYHN